MSYSPPAGDAVGLVFDGVYTPPAGDAVELNFDSTSAPVYSSTVAADLDPVAGSLVAVPSTPATLSATLDGVSGAWTAVPSTPAVLVVTLDPVAGDLLAIPSAPAALNEALDDVGGAWAAVPSPPLTLAAVLDPVVGNLAAVPSTPASLAAALDGVSGTWTAVPSTPAVLVGALESVSAAMIAVPSTPAVLIAGLDDVLGALAVTPSSPLELTATLEPVAGLLAVTTSTFAALSGALEDVQALFSLQTLHLAEFVAPLDDCGVESSAVWSAGVFRGLTASRSMPHAVNIAPVRRMYRGITDQAPRKPALQRLPWADGTRVPAQRAAGWTQVRTRPASHAAAWETAVVQARTVQDGQRAAPRRSKTASAVWHPARPIERGRFDRYRSPPARPLAVDGAYGRATPRAFEWLSASGIGTPIVLQRFVAPWGIANPHSWIWGGWFYPPPPPAPPYTPSTDLVFYQRQEDFTGGAILEFNRPCWAWPLSDTRTLTTAGAIIVLHTIHVVRLPDLVNVPVLAVSLQFDIDSWAWGVSLSLQTPAAIALLEPIDGEPRQVRIDLNGVLFTMLIESWGKTRQFGETLYTASGRSPLAVFAAPYAPLRSYLEPDPQTAAQLIDRELANTGWSAAYHPDLLQLFTTDWLVPGGTWSYQNKSPLDAIRQIAAAAGARAFADRNNAVLHIQPRYPVSPWDWAAATPDKSIPIGLARSVSTQLQPRPDYDQIYVSGQHQGVLVNAIRQGSAGGNPAPMVTDPLITYVNAGRERARNVLADTGRQARVSLDLPLSPITGLIEPGQLTEVSDAVPWRGLAVGVNINATHGAISQRIEIERHYS
jgi:hypothetical protein